MNKLSHIVFAVSLFVGLYSLIYGFSVWQSDLGRLRELMIYYVGGGLGLSVFSTPILYWKAPHRNNSRSIGNLGAVSALFFVTFCIGSLIGTVVYQWYSGVPMIGNLSVSIGALITLVGALMPDWDIPFLGISRHRNVVFHSFVLPLLIVFGSLLNVTFNVISASSLAIGAHIEYYVTALFLVGYASHLYLDIFPSDASPLEIVWRAANPTDQAPTGLKPLGPVRISKRGARGWLVGNATLLVIIGLALFGLYFYNLSILAP